MGEERKRRPAVEADMPGVQALHRRAELLHLLDQQVRVRVSNPLGGIWTGRIVGLSDQPAMLLERPDGVRVMLSQAFAVEELPLWPRT
jgi:hypothetical protein